MGTPHIILLFMVMLLVAILIEPLAQRIKLSFSAVLVLTGYFMSEAFVAAGIDTGIRWNNFQDIISYMLIPVLVFEAACQIRLQELIKDLLTILILAIPLMLISAGIIAIVLYYGVNHPTGFPWEAALITGALLSATDPASVSAILKQNQVTARLGLILEGESLFNDAAAIVLFSVVLSMALAMNSNSPIDHGDWGTAALRFIQLFAGGLLTGLVIGGITWSFAWLFGNPVSKAVITVISAFLAYIIAEDYLHFSGVMSVLACGLVIGECLRRTDQYGNLVLPLWDILGFIAVSTLFLLGGITITSAMFTSHWLAILYGVLAITLARMISIFGLLPVTNWLPARSRWTWNDQVILTAGGTRGAVSLALALSLPIELEYWYSVQSITYGVVLFTLFIQSPLTDVLIRKSASAPISDD